MSIENLLSSNFHRIYSEKDICNICFNNISDKNYCITSCNHKFCLSCILISIKYKNTCPCCRTELTSNDYINRNNTINTRNINQYMYTGSERIRNEIGVHDSEYDNQYNDLLINDNFYISIRNDILLFRIKLLENIINYLERLVFRKITKNYIIETLVFGILIGIGVGTGLQLGYFLTKCTLFLFLYVNNIFI